MLLLGTLPKSEKGDGMLSYLGNNRWQLVCGFSQIAEIWLTTPLKARWYFQCSVALERVEATFDFTGTDAWLVLNEGPWGYNHLVQIVSGTMVNDWSLDDRTRRNEVPDPVMSRALELTRGPRNR
jgi:hypothetical protein